MQPFNPTNKKNPATPVRDLAKAILNMDVQQAQPLPEGHTLEFPVPDNAQYVRDNGIPLPQQYFLHENRKKDNFLKPIRFHHLVKYVSGLRLHYKQYWVFKCVCGKRMLAEKSRYRCNRVRHCGCLQEPQVSSKQHSKPNVKGLHDGSRDAETTVKPQVGETVEMFTGNVHKREGRVVVSIDDAYGIWDGHLTLQEVIEKKKRMGKAYFEQASNRKYTKQLAIESERKAISDLRKGVGKHNW